MVSVKVSLHFGCTLLPTNLDLLFSWWCGKCFKQLCLVGLSIGFSGVYWLDIIATESVLMPSAN
jgi:hypothetical protein